MQLISKPSKRVAVTFEEVVKLQTGRRAQFVKPFGIGELAILHNQDHGWIDTADAVRLRLGGELICRVGPE